jgi:hypothetical protein
VRARLPGERLALRVHGVRENPPQDRFAALVIEGICLKLLYALMLIDRIRESDARTDA